MPSDDARTMQELLSKLSVDSIQESTRFVEHADLKIIQIDDLKAALFEMLKAYGCYTKSIKEGQPLFRAMKHNTGEEFFENVKRIYPDRAFLKTLGRANREHQPIFYFSGGHVIAFHEVKAKPGDVISLLECRPIEGATPVLVPIGIDALMNKHGLKASGDFPETSVRIEQLLNNDAECLRKYWIIDSFITNEFLKHVADGQSQEYKTTIAIAELLLSFGTELRPVDGLAYPSISGMWTHANIALVPDAFFRLYKPLACQRIKITGLLPNLGFSLEPEIGVMAIAIKENGKIDWP